ncbi:N-acetylneuraminate synthase [Sphingomonas sp. Leaf412]|uniref:N-acetylneuraminate synthase n=1 Tax=Sphingomonas sp. Leaf412 TaxID=1736370 RepID=UPI0006FE9FA0|nr:N-acetylneuraminate synthase [Sphingomonas sp. Leaf412]KQT31161.1 N-acetylneuraminate synthase [Sphingomonas sp. Leaf412]
MTAPRTYFIAEAGVNHNGDRDLAFALVEGAADAGADAVKFQTFDADLLASATVGKAGYQEQRTGAGESQRDMLRKLELPHDWHVELQAHARARSIDFISTAFDPISLDMLVGIGMPIVKVPSGELTNAPMVWRYANAGKPIVLSTGMATLSDVELALAVISHAIHEVAEPRSIADVWRIWGDPDRRAALRGRVTILHCTTQYPAADSDVNLAAMRTLGDAFGLPVGYSDHSAGSTAAIAAVALGATVIEKHFTTDRSLPGPDHAASLEIDELTQLIACIRSVEVMRGDGVKVPQPSEWDMRRVARQKVVAARPIARGAVLERVDLTTARSGDGIDPAELWDMIGTVAPHDLAAGDVYRR